MREVPAPGEPVSVIWRGSSPENVRGRLHAIHGGGVSVQIAQPALPIEPQTEVMLVAGEIGNRLVAKARYFGCHSGLGLFGLVTRFHPFDLRGQTRYPVVAPAEVRSRLAQAWVSGRILDISLGGAAIEVGERPAGRRVEARLQLFGYSATLPCGVVDVGERGTRVVLHLKFEPLTHLQQAFVRNAVEYLANQASLARAS